jgi:ankyrin repeat protein
MRVLADEPTLCTHDDTPSALMAALYQFMFRAAGAITARRESLTVFEAAAMGETAQLSDRLAAEGAVSEFADDGFTALHLACFFSRPGAVSLLLEAGADPNAVATNGSELRPLHSAAAGRSPEIIAMLLRAGAEPDARQRGGYTALHAAAQHGDQVVADTLIEDGANPRLADDEGKTAGDHARASGHEALADRLDSIG